MDHIYPRLSFLSLTHIQLFMLFGSNLITRPSSCPAPTPRGTRGSPSPQRSTHALLSSPFRKNPRSLLGCGQRMVWCPMFLRWMVTLLAAVVRLCRALPAVARESSVPLLQGALANSGRHRLLASGENCCHRDSWLVVSFAMLCSESGAAQCLCRSKANTGAPLRPRWVTQFQSFLVERIMLIDLLGFSFCFLIWRHCSLWSCFSTVF